MYNSRQPNSLASRSARLRGVNPLWKPVTGLPTGSRSLYRQMLLGPRAIDSRVTLPFMAA